MDSHEMNLLPELFSLLLQGSQQGLPLFSNCEEDTSFQYIQTSFAGQQKQVGPHHQ
jgi:hypothetical protein